jgi:two-component system phosphate regulon sensor histidine kinase PhoR
MPIKLPGRSLKAQLITLLFGFTAVAISVFGFLAVRAVLVSGDRTSNIAVDSRKAIVEQIMEQAATATADKNSRIFQDIASQSSSATTFAKSLFDHPANYPSTDWRFDAHVSKLPNGQYTNAASEASSVLVNPGVKLTSAIKHELELTAYLDGLLPQLLKNEPNIAAGYFIGAQGDVRYYPNIELAKITPPDFNTTQADFFTVGDPQHDPGRTLKWTSVYDDPAGNGLMITATNPIYTTAGAFMGVIGLDVTLGNIAKNIESYSPIESSYAFLMSNDGRAIALPATGYQDLLGRAPGKTEFGTDLSSVKGDFATILGHMKSGQPGFSSVTAGGTALYVAYAPIQNTNFSLAIVAREAVLLKVVSDLKAQVASSSSQVLYLRVLPAALILLLVVWVFGFLYIRLITDPIKQLTARTTLISKGDLNVEPAAVTADNEIGVLAQSFNHMVADLRTSRAQIAEQNQELLHNQQTRLKASINSLNVGFIMTDTPGRVILLNEAAREILTYGGLGLGDHPHRLPDAEHWTMSTITTRLGEKVAFTTIVERALETGKPVELKEVDFEGSILRIYVAPIVEHRSHGTEKLGAVILIEDITAVKMAERSRDEFFSIASHELRTPLTAVRGNAAMLAQIFGAKIKNQDFDEMVSDIHGASVRLIEIVNDFLDASRLEQGRIAYENQTLAVQNTIGEVVTEMANVAKEKGNQIKTTAAIKKLPPIYADPSRVKQVIYNLIGNAMKFTDDGTITLDGQVDGRLLKILVSDTGPGITPEKQHLLFRKFQQAGNTRLNHDASRGTGLGLYISKLLSEQMGGHIVLEHSKVGVGTTFSVSLPLASQSAGTPAAGPTPARQTRKRTPRPE